MTQLTQTCTIESELDGKTILAVLSDLANLPRWAPQFAPQVDIGPTGDCTVSRGDERFSLRLVAGASGCVDYLRSLPGGGEGGAFIRVLPRPSGGSVVVMTVPVGRGAEQAGVREILEDELRRLVSLCRSGVRPDA